MRENAEANNICVCVGVYVWVCWGGGGGVYTDNAKAHSPLVSRQRDSAAPSTQPAGPCGNSPARRLMLTQMCFSVGVDSAETLRRGEREPKPASLLMHDGNEKKREPGHVFSVISYQKTQFWRGGVIQAEGRLLLCVILHSAAARVHWSMAENHL